jgi:hypothetical protein
LGTQIVCKLYVHCGLQKTGTTSLQDYLYRRKEELRALGYNYPPIGIKRGRHAHHHLAYEMLEKARFDPAYGTISDLLSYCGSADRVRNIIISSEFLAAALTKDGARERFLAFLRNAREVNDDVYAIFTFRSFWRRAESAYFEDLMNGQHVRSLRQHVAVNKHWLANFFRQMNTLRDILGAEHILALDVEAANRDSISAVLASVGLREDRLPRRRAEGNLNTRLSLKKAAYLYALQHGPDGRFKKQTAVDVFSIVRAIKDIPPLPNDKSDYRIFSIDQANEIQAFVRSLVPSFLLEDLRNLIELETAEFDVTDLATVQLTEEDYAIINAARKAHAAARAL